MIPHPLLNIVMMNMSDKHGNSEFRQLMLQKFMNRLNGKR